MTAPFIVGQANAAVLAELGYVEGRDYVISPPLPRSWPEPEIKIKPSTIARMARPLTPAGAR